MATDCSKMIVFVEEIHWLIFQKKIYAWPCENLVRIEAKVVWASQELPSKGPEGPPQRARRATQRARRALWARAPRARLHQNTTPTESRNDIARNSFARVWGRRHLRSALLNQLKNQ